MTCNIQPVFKNICKLTTSQLKRTKSLIREECCNCDSDNCKCLDNGKYIKCPQLDNSTLVCSWFKEAVLPLNPVLENEIFGVQTAKNPKGQMKRCDVCGRIFKPKSPRTRHCPECAQKEYKKQQANYARKKRDHSRNLS